MMMKQQAMFKNMSNEPLANRLRPTTLTALNWTGKDFVPANQ